jgi:hypothetical protein
VTAADRDDPGLGGSATRWTGAAPDRTRRIAALTAVTVTATVLWLSAGAGGGGGLVIPLGSLDQLARWAYETTPLVMAFAITRLAAFAACGYLSLALALLVLADLLGSPRGGRLALRALPTFMRRTMARGVPLGLAASAVLGSLDPVAATPADQDHQPVAATPADRHHQPFAATPEDRGDDPVVATATMWRLGPDPAAEAPPPIATMVLLGADPPAPVPQPSMDPAAATSAADSWVVGAGDSFWSIAEVVVAQAHQDQQPAQPARAEAEADEVGAQTEAEVGRYWSRLVAANRDRLAAPGHPDLLIPGQTLVLPPFGSRSPGSPSSGS